MTKKKKLLFSILAVLCAALFSVIGVFAILEHISYAKITFPLHDTLPNGEGKKATVILLGGQSNASGCSRDDYLQKNVSPDQYSEYEKGYDNVYINYYVSANNASYEFVKCATKQGEEGTCFGPELGMAEKLNELYPDELFFIIKCAWGATELYTQWISPSSPGKTGQNYKEFVRFVQTSMDYLISKNYDVKIEGMCWMQGESDSFSVETATGYQMHLSNFIKDLRGNFSRYAPSDGIAFVDAYIAALPAYWVYHDLVNQSKQAAADADPMHVVFDTNAEGLTTLYEPIENPDIPHYDSLSQLKLGYLFIENLAQFLDV